MHKTQDGNRYGSNVGNGLLSHLTDNLGRCPRCMRIAFFMALAAIPTAALAAHFARFPFVAVAAWGVAVALVLLWLAHLAAFAARSAKGPGPLNSRAAGLAAANPSSPPRRQFISAFSKSFVLATVVAALPTRASFAQSHMSRCLTCCAKKLKACGPTRGDCNTLYQNCVANCNSQSETPSDWQCW